MQIPIKNIIFISKKHIIITAFTKYSAIKDFNSFVRINVTIECFRFTKMHIALKMIA